MHDRRLARVVARCNDLPGEVLFQYLDDVEAVKNVSRRLGNTPSVWRKCYVHPQIFDAYLDGHLVAVLEQRAEAELESSLATLLSEESAVLLLLRDRLAGKRPAAPAPADEEPPCSRAA